ncbi:transposase [Dactylosporangium sp. NPDC006015]|uniref:transposase n=1 Tax=Dactylosporangium sp. NPDC006015 TaxID=3154576 RepID=UPI0033A49FDE
MFRERTRKVVTLDQASDLRFNAVQACDPVGGRGSPGPGVRGRAIRRIADQVGVHPEALRTWVKQAETDAGQQPGTTSSDAERIAALEREVRELRRANQILKSAASSFAAELDLPSR